MTLDVRFKGGKGSGNFGHSGRPGKIGGSGPGKNYADADEALLLKRYAVLGTWASTDINVKQHNAVFSYTDSSYKRINSALRKDKPITRAVSQLDEAFNKAPSVPQDMKVYRGGKDLGLSPGDTFIDKAYVSTTISRDYADGFSGGVIYEINVPKGAVGMYAELISPRANEKEFILPRGTTFKVAAVEGNTVTLDVMRTLYHDEWIDNKRLIEAPGT